MSEENTTQDFADLYADLTACFLALSNALENAGAVGKAQIAESAQERFIAIHSARRPDEPPPPPLFLLRTLAINLASTPLDPLSPQ